MKMKMYLSMLFLVFGFTLQAQSFGSASIKVEGTFNANKAIYHDWLRLGNTQDVTMKFPLTAQGVEDAMDITQQMLVKNRLFIEKPDVYKSVETGSNKSDSPQELHNAIQQQKSKINLAWYAPDGSTLHLFLGKYSYEVTIYKAYKLQ
ncbi:hypothetical protein [Flavobacterium litorale]|uniref:Uncharacterized protein n=1 Tax=Flavobacterium litorale TaxID=2856519 RepID=A0ABX8V5A7_9FLAO|nr:hypothetical protein [Flavobacterium litorale]QYJ68024.1 hypothetical protein K1I41_10880 [Flavobacterium litorale]